MHVLWDGGHDDGDWGVCGFVESVIYKGHVEVGVDEVVAHGSEDDDREGDGDDNGKEDDVDEVEGVFVAAILGAWEGRRMLARLEEECKFSSKGVGFAHVELRRGSWTRVELAGNMLLSRDGGQRYIVFFCKCMDTWRPRSDRGRQLSTMLVRERAVHEARQQCRRHISDEFGARRLAGRLRRNKTGWRWW